MNSSTFLLRLWLRSNPAHYVDLRVCDVIVTTAGALLAFDTDSATVPAWGIGPGEWLRFERVGS